MDPVYAIPAFIVFTVAGIAVLIRIATSPIRGARHLFKIINPNVGSEDKEESKETLKTSRIQATSYLGFIVATTFLMVAFFLVSPYLPLILNQILLVCIFALLFISFRFSQNRLL
jgi:hypothetical protein